MRRIFVMRHGQVDNPQGVIYSNLPGFHLSDIGRKQVREAADFFSDVTIDIIITSGLERTQETGEIVVSRQSKTPKILVDARIRDNDMGERSGILTGSEYSARQPEIWQERIDGYLGAEPPLVTQKRFREAFDESVAKFSDATILFISHGDPIAFLRQSLLGADIAPMSPDWRTSKTGIWEIILGNPNRTNLIFEPITK